MVDCWVLGSNHIKFCRIYSPLLFTFHILFIRWLFPKFCLFDRSITKNKLKLNKLFKIIIFIWRWCASPLVHLYGEKVRTLGKGYGIKWGAIGNTLEEHLGTWGTSWKQIKNMMGTQELRNFILTHILPQRKKYEPSWVYV